MNATGDPKRQMVVDDVAGGVVGTIPFFGPLLAPLGSLLAGAVAEEWKRNTSTALAAAERLSGLTREDLAEAIDRDRRLVPLMTRVLFQAGLSGDEDKLNALGAGLGLAVANPERMDEADVLLAAIDGITGQHISVLRLLTENPPPFDDTTPGIRCVWSGYNIPKRAGLTADLGSIVLTGLLNAGLVSKRETYNYVGEYHPTALGRLLLDVLVALNEQKRS